LKPFQVLFLVFLIFKVASPIVIPISSPEVKQDLKKETSNSLSKLKLPKDWIKKLTESNKLGAGGFGAVYEILTGTGKMV
jgi:hypothetical protein